MFRSNRFFSSVVIGAVSFSFSCANSIIGSTIGFDVTLKAKEVVEEFFSNESVKTLIDSVSRFINGVDPKEIQPKKIVEEVLRNKEVVKILESANVLVDRLNPDDFEKIGKEGIVTLKNLREISENVKNFTGKLDPGDFQEIKERGISALEKTISEGTKIFPRIDSVLKTVNSFLKTINLILAAVFSTFVFNFFKNTYSSISISLSSIKKLFSFGGKKKKSSNSRDYFKVLDNIIKGLVMDSKDKAAISTILLTQMSNKATTDHKLVVLAGTGNSVALEKFRTLAQKKCSDDNFKIYFKRVNVAKVGFEASFNKIQDALDGEGKYADKNGLLILDFCNEDSSLKIDPALKEKYSPYFVEFSQEGVYEVAISEFKSAMCEIKDFFALKGINIILSDNLIEKIGEAFEGMKVADVFEEIKKIKYNICMLLNQIKPDSPPVGSKLLDVVIDLNEDNVFSVYKED